MVIERVLDSVGVVTRGWELAMYKPPQGIDSNGSGRVVKRDILGGKVVVYDFRSKQLISFRGMEIGDPQNG